MGIVLIKMQDDNGDEFMAMLKDVMYVPGLSCRLFSITKFAHHGHVAVTKDNVITLYFEPHAAAVTLTSLSGGNNLAADDIRVHQQILPSEEYHAVCEDNLDPQLDQGNKEVIRVTLLTFGLKR
jgi:hypothetical protein